MARLNRRRGNPVLRQTKRSFRQYLFAFKGLPSDQGAEPILATTKQIVFNSTSYLTAASIAKGSQHSKTDNNLIDSTPDDVQRVKTGSSTNTFNVLSPRILGTDLFKTRILV